MPACVIDVLERKIEFHRNFTRPLYSTFFYVTDIEKKVNAIRKLCGWSRISNVSKVVINLNFVKIEANNGRNLFFF